MESIVCVICNPEKSNNKFYNKFRECKQCNIKRNLKRYFENKDKLSNQRKLFYEENRDVLFSKSKLNQRDRNYEKNTNRRSQLKVRRFNTSY